MRSTDKSGEIESPLLDEEFFTGDTKDEWESRLVQLDRESPFSRAFEGGPPYRAEPETDRFELDEGELEVYEDEGSSDFEEDQAGEDAWSEQLGVVRLEPWENEINRNTSTYLRWVQQSLNRILGIRLAADGIMGARTRGAIRTFQVRQGLTPSGVVDAPTEAALIAAGAGPPPGGLTPPIPDLPTTAVTSFIPVPVENPGGGRIQNKRDPVPADVVNVSGVGGKNVQLHRLAADAWRALVNAARVGGIAEPLLLPVSGYRSSQHQAELFRAAVERYKSPSEARKWVAPPGGSAHQSGRAIDFYLGGQNSSRNVAALRRKPAYLWLREHAQRFGFYPYEREPWHWEYNPPAVGEERESVFDAFGVDESGLDVDEERRFLEPEEETEALRDLEQGFNEFHDEEHKASYVEQEQDAFPEYAGPLQEEPLIPEETWIEREQEEGDAPLDETAYLDEESPLDEEFFVEADEGVDGESAQRHAPRGWQELESGSPVSDLRRRIVAIAKREWENWGRGTLDETDPSARTFLREYWKSIEYTQAQADKAIGKRHAWSAVFISYVMQKAEVGDAFTYAAYHSTYVAAAKKAAIAQDSAKFQAFEISVVKPEIGDVVCRDRKNEKTKRCDGTNFANVAPTKLSHGDIVVEVGTDHIVILGGNTGQTHPINKGKTEDTVGQRKIKLNKQGFVTPDQRRDGCKYFAIVRPPGSSHPSSQGSGDSALASLPKQLSEAVRKGLFGVQVAWTILSGQRDENKLTSMIFLARHPGRDPKEKIKPHEKQLARDWLDIRDRIVRPDPKGSTRIGRPGSFRAAEPAGAVARYNACGSWLLGNAGGSARPEEHKDQGT